MNRNRIGALLLSAALTLGLSVPALAEEAAPALTRAESAAQAAEYAAKYGGATSVQYAVWEDGKLTITGHSGVYSRTENRALMDTDLYGIGSVSKVYTTAAVMKLAEAGKINLDSSVTKYLPTFKMEDARYKDITVRMLLNHSSGLMGSSTAGAFLFADGDRSATTDLLSRLSTQRLKADPGAYSVYCNDGFTLAELVVEAVSGVTFNAYLQTALFTPAKLENTFVPGGDFDTDRLTKTYLGTDPRALPQDTLGIVGTGGIYATASDLAAFGGLLTGTDLLSKKSTAAMAAPEYKNGLWPADDEDRLAYGLGWDSVRYYPFAYSDIQALAKGGDTLYYHAGLVVLPEHNMAAAVLTSGGVSTYNEMAAARMLIDALKEKGVTVDETLPVLPSAKPAEMPKTLTEHSGYYGSSLQQMKIDVTEDGNLTIHSMTVPGMPNQVFSYRDDGSFRDPTGSAMLKFVKAENGKTYIWQKACGNIPGLGLMPASNYLAQKLESGATDQAVLDAWTKTNAMGYVPLNERYTSQLYLSILQAPAELPELVPGYAGASVFEDATHTRAVVQIPGTAGRDCQEITVSQREGVTYLSSSQGLLYADVSTVKGIYAGEGAYCTVGADGYARWCLVGAATGLKMTVTLPQHGGFTVYHADGTVAASSVVYGDKTVTLPEGGYIVFAGDPGERFHLDFMKE